MAIQFKTTQQPNTDTPPLLVTLMSLKGQVISKNIFRRSALVVSSHANSLGSMCGVKDWPLRFLPSPQCNTLWCSTDSTCYKNVSFRGSTLMRHQLMSSCSRKEQQNIPLTPQCMLFFCDENDRSSDQSLDLLQY